MRAMRTLFVAACPLPWPRGTPIRIHRMAEALLRRGHDVHVATYALGDPAIETPYPVHRVGQCAELDPAPGPSIEKLLHLDPQLFRRLRGLLTSERFDVIHAHHYEGLILALLATGRRRRLPVVFDAHTLLGTELPYYDTPVPVPRSWARFAGTWIDRQLPRRAEHVLAVTDRMRDWLVTYGGVPAPRISVIPNGVEHEHFDADSEAVDRSHALTDSNAADRAHLLPDTDAPHHTASIVFAGNLAGYQGLDLLLESFRIVRERIDHASLTLLTEPEPGEPREDWHPSDTNGSVSIVRSDYAALPARLHGADVLVNPRPGCDGIPQKLLNYMAAGRPIVSFEGSAAILEHERTALLVPDGDTRAFAHAVLRLLEDRPLGRRLGDAARAKVVAEHSWQHVAEEVERVYESLAGKTAGRRRVDESRGDES